MIATNANQWLASDGWGRQGKLVEGLEEEAEGAITVELQSERIPGFDEYMASRTPENNQRNPWFGEYWEEVFGCTLRRNTASPERFSQGSWRTSSGNGGNQSHAICSSKLRLTAASGYEQESKVQFVVDAVYAFALAFDNLRHDLCSHVSEGLCSSMANYDRGAFYRNYLLNVSFRGESPMTLHVSSAHNSTDIIKPSRSFVPPPFPPHRAPFRLLLLRGYRRNIAGYGRFQGGSP